MPQGWCATERASVVKKGSLAAPVLDQIMTVDVTGHEVRRRDTNKVKGVLLEGIGPESDTPQMEGLPGQVENAAGGYSFAVDDWERLRRFLILGTDGGTYYVAPRPFTKDSLKAVERCIQADPNRTFDVLYEILMSGRSPKIDPALYALALLWQSRGNEVRHKIRRDFVRMVRTGTQLLHFANFLKQLGNRIEGRATRRLIASWYIQPAERVEFQAVKYQMRDDWRHRDLLRLAHPHSRLFRGPGHDPAWVITDEHRSIYNWVTKGVVLPGHSGSSPIAALERAKTGIPPESRGVFIRANRMFREQLPTEWLNDPLVWDALVDTDMPAMALLRNLATLTAKGYLSANTAGESKVLARLADVERFAKARVHPVSVLLALRTYQQGHGEKGKLRWTPVQSVCTALDALFYQLFSTVEPTNKRILIALDVSGSMGSLVSGLPISVREAAAAVAQVIHKTEPRAAIIGFTASATALDGRTFSWSSTRQKADPDEAVTRLSIERDWNLRQVTDYTATLDFGGTDCAAPMLWAIKHKLNVDTFLILTDNETWAGPVHPIQALKKYREQSGISAKLVTVAMTSTGYSIGDPNDRGCLDVVGFDAAVPTLISDFIKSE